VSKLDGILKQSLRTVEAPGELWQRLHTPRDPEPVKLRAANQFWYAWAGAAMLMASSAVGLHAYLKTPDARAGLQTALSQPVSQAAGRNAPAARLRSWVRSGTGLDIRAACRLCHEGEESLTAWN